MAQLVSRASVALTASALMIVRDNTNKDLSIYWIISAVELIIEPIPSEQL